jgi:UDP-N-acetylglucosamine--N-acetylmuramyl-(pentapeptide) pyrophosphoryl-undecaprenol N-acetylglucosamine transferase
MAAGATGGHIMPAVALAQAMREMDSEVEFLFVGAGRESEAKILDPLSFPRRVIKSKGIKGVGLWKKIQGFMAVFSALFQALKIIKEFKPDLVFGAGGYASFPVGLAGFLKRIPLVIHEQNLRPGLANRMLGRLSLLIFLGDAQGARFFPRGKCVRAGNPVRRDIARLKGAPRKEGPFTLLILGGSQGSSALNRAALGLLDRYRSLKIPFKVIHQCGREGREEIERAYREAGVDAWVRDFFQDMADVLSQSSLAVSRAGALALSEFAAANLPAILIPLPGAADDHQSGNAESYRNAGAGILLPERELTPETLWRSVSDLLENRGKLEEMRRSAAAIKNPDSAAFMAETIFALPAFRGRGPGVKAAAERPETAMKSP